MAREIVRKQEGNVWRTEVGESSVGPGGAWGEASTAQFSGAGSPVGAVTPSGAGDLYVDTAGPTLWQATGVTDTDWQQVGNGGSQPGAAIVRGPFPFAYNTPGLADGYAFYTPTIGDILLDAWVEIDTAWDGAAANGDLGTAVGASAGLLSANLAIFDVTSVDSDGFYGEGVLMGSCRHLAGGSDRTTPARFVAANPLKVWVSQDGLAGGDAPGASQGAARIYIVTATPAAP